MGEKLIRKNYLDNIRWMTIVFVVIFHVFFYYNNIGIDAMFKGVSKYSGQITFAGIFQYFVYPWFMLLLFIVAGMSARYALKNKTEKQFLHARIDKLLVPSTLGVLAFGWIGGYIIFIHNASANTPQNIPGFVGVIITLCSGIGALWFCQVLFVASLVLLLVKKIVKCFHGTDDLICNWFEKNFSTLGKFSFLLIILYLMYWGASHILNMPMITSYRNGIYIVSFLTGYYIFSNERIIENLTKMIIPLFILSIISGVFYIYRCYGLYYADAKVLCRWDVNLYAFFMVSFILGFGSKFLNFKNRFTEYMKKHSFGIYVLHIPVLLVTNYGIEKLDFPMPLIYFIELIIAFIISIVLYEIIHKIPVLRYCIFGLRKKK